VLSEALRFVAEPGQLIIPRLGDPTIALSHLPSFPGGQSYRQALQLLYPDNLEPHEDLTLIPRRILLYGGQYPNGLLVIPETPVFKCA